MFCLPASYNDTSVATGPRAQEALDIADLLYLSFLIHRLPVWILACPSCLTLVQARLAVTDFNSGDIYVYDVRSGSSDPLTTLKVGKLWIA